MPSSAEFSCFMRTYDALLSSSPTRMVPSPGVTPRSPSSLTSAVSSTFTDSRNAFPSSNLAVMTVSMQEVALAGEHHGETEVVGVGDQLLVAHGPARLDHDGDAGGDRGVDAVGEGIERVARRRTAGGAAVGLAGGELGGVHPALLARADADGLLVLDEHDRVRLHVTDEAPGELG